MESRWDERFIRKTNCRGGVCVSTVFLGVDYNFSMEGPPIVFETMVFGGIYDQEMWRYSEYDKAWADHDRIVALVKKSLGYTGMRPKVIFAKEK